MKQKSQCELNKIKKKNYHQQTVVHLDCKFTPASEN